MIDEMGLAGRLRAAEAEFPKPFVDTDEIGGLYLEAAEALEAKDAEIERLVAERDESDRAASAMSSDLFRMADERDKLKEALKPFADAAESIDDTVPDRAEMWEAPAAMETTAGDFRRARQALGDT